MIIFLDRKGNAVAIFEHFSDSVEYEQHNPRHRYTKLDYPNLSELIGHLIGEAIGGHLDRPGGRIAPE